MNYNKQFNNNLMYVLEYDNIQKFKIRLNQLLKLINFIIINRILNKRKRKIIFKNKIRIYFK